MCTSRVAHQLASQTVFPNKNKRKQQKNSNSNIIGHSVVSYVSSNAGVRKPSKKSVERRLKELREWDSDRESEWVSEREVIN